MALRLNKILNVVSNVSGAAAKMDAAGNFSFLSSLGSGIKASGIDINMVKNVIGTTTGFDLSKFVSVEKIGSIFGMDLSMDSLLPSGMSMDSITKGFDISSMTKDLDLNNIQKELNVDIPDMNSLDIPSVEGMTSEVNAEGSISEATNAIESAMGDISGSMSSITDFSNMDILGQFGLSSIF